MKLTSIIVEWSGETSPISLSPYPLINPYVRFRVTFRRAHSSVELKVLSGVSIPLKELLLAVSNNNGNSVKKPR
ncbi:MAG: hypothetical protein LBF59_04710 [Prevotellaceae bacterium]|jgi:hypothetical protein|nr:hypothetical protein [Prevotellaceae bacterium]